MQNIFLKKCFFNRAAVICLVSLYVTCVTGCSKDTTAATATPTGINKVNHVIVIYMENHSFDNLYGSFPGANGLSNATTAKYTQIDTATGYAYTTLPWSDTTHFKPKPAYPNKPFDIGTVVPANMPTNDLVHRYYQEQTQIDGGKMDKFAAISDAKGLSMGYYQTAQFPMYSIAQQYTVCDNFFHSAFGGSFLNHIFFITAAPPQFPGAPSPIVAKLDANGKLISDGQVAADGVSGINTSFTVNTPHPAASTNPVSSSYPANLFPNQTMPTIGDRMNDKSVTWAWYSGGWNNALAGNAGSLFQFHHQPFAFFANYADGKQAKADHLKDETDFDAAVAAGTLPSVAFLKPYGIDNEHPGYTDVMTGDTYLAAKINTIKASPIWKDCVIIVTYDEHGGFWDHVAPPVIDKWGPGSRVPGIIISPFAKTGFIDHTQYETVSILSFIEKRFGLTPLGTRDAAANPFSNAFTF
jgi:acid phosphatase